MEDLTEAPDNKTFHTPAPSRKAMTLMERLGCVLESYEQEEIESSEKRRKRKLCTRRLLCQVAAENRRWRANRSPPELPQFTLLQLAEEALGKAFVDGVVNTIYPPVDYCALRWKPSAVDDNNELCRIKRHRPACEPWTDETL